MLESGLEGAGVRVLGQADAVLGEEGNARHAAQHVGVDGRHGGAGGGRGDEGVQLAEGVAAGIV